PVQHIFYFQAEDGKRDRNVTGVQTCALPICFMVEMNAQEALKNINAPSDIKVEHSDVMSASPDMADLFICGRDLEENTKNLGDRSEERRVGKECRFVKGGELMRSED